jgi:hypothetical protein
MHPANAMMQEGTSSFVKDVVVYEREERRCVYRIGHTLSSDASFFRAVIDGSVVF